MITVTVVQLYNNYVLASKLFYKISKDFKAINNDFIAIFVFVCTFVRVCATFGSARVCYLLCTQGSPVFGHRILFMMPGIELQSVLPTVLSF